MVYQRTRQPLTDQPTPIDPDGGEKLGHRIRAYRWPNDWLIDHPRNTLYDFLKWHRKAHAIEPDRALRWNWRVMVKALRERPVNVDALRVFYWITHHMDRENHAAVWTGNIQSELDLPKQRLMRAIQTLVRKQWVIRLRGKRHVIRTRFVVDPDIVCAHPHTKQEARRLWAAFERRVRENPNVG